MPENQENPTPVGRVPSRGVCGLPTRGAGASDNPQPKAGSVDPAYKPDSRAPVSRLPSAGASSLPSDGVRPGADPPAGSGDPAYKSGLDELPPRRLRRLHRVWPDRDGNISYLLTLCVDGRARILDNDATFQRLTAFLL